MTEPHKNKLAGGFCGFLSAGPGVHADAGAWLGAMAGRLPGGAAGLATDLQPPLALAGGSCHRDERWQVAITGDPRWPDQDLRAAAREAPARALALACERYGDRLLEHLHGSFALVTFDRRTATLRLAVDRMGIKGLAYAVAADGRLVFATDAGAVAADPGVGRDLSLQAVHDFFYFHMVPSPGTVYARVQKLRPGHCLVTSAAAAPPAPTRYWQPRFAARTEADAAALGRQLHAGLRDAVRACEPGAGIGAFLSGGIDSSTVVGCLAEQLDAPVETFSVGFGADEYDELEYARLVAGWAGASAHEYLVTPEDIVAAIPRIAAAYDEPFGNSSAVPTLMCATLAREHGVHTLLAGDGGDELFAGNPHYTRQTLFEVYWRLPAPARRWLASAPVRGLCRGPLHKLGSYIEQAQIPMPDRLWSWHYLIRQDRAGVFAPELLAAVDPDHPLALMRGVYAEPQAPAGAVDRMLYLDWQFILADNDLRKVGRMCELAGVGVRFPMLDDGLVEFSTQVPAALKLRGQRLRAFFKDAMRGFLPAAVLSKQKHGFGLPFGLWLKEHRGLQDLVYGAMHDCAARGLFAAGFVDALIAGHREGQASYFGYPIWDIVMLEHWLQAHGLSV